MENYKPCHVDLSVDYAILQADNAALREELERERMRLVACGVAAMQNTDDSRKERITRDNEYCSQSYIDVCTAVDREIAIREKLARLVKAAKHYIITPDADEITKRLALHDLRMCISDVEDDK